MMRFFTLRFLDGADFFSERLPEVTVVAMVICDPFKSTGSSVTLEVLQQ